MIISTLVKLTVKFFFYITLIKLKIGIKAIEIFFLKLYLNLNINFSLKGLFDKIFGWFNGAQCSILL